MVLLLPTEKKVSLVYWGYTNTTVQGMVDPTSYKQCLSKRLNTEKFMSQTYEIHLNQADVIDWYFY